MRIADVAMFIFIFQIVLATLNGISLFSSGEIRNSYDVEKQVSDINKTVQSINTDVQCNDIFCSIAVGLKQLYFMFQAPFSILVNTIGRAIFLGRFLSDIFKPVDPDGTLSKLFYIFDAVGVISFGYGIVQFLRGIGFKVFR